MILIEKYNQLTGDICIVTITTNESYHCWKCMVDLDLEDFPDLKESGEPTGIALPYIVTVDLSSRGIISKSIRRNWYEEDPSRKCLDRMHFVHYQYLTGVRILWLSV